MNEMNQLYALLSPEKRALLQQRILRRNASPRAVTTVRDGPRQLSFGQESLWFFSQLESNSPVYNIPQAFRMRGPLKVEALRRALETIVHRHESLRTNFGSDNDLPSPIVSAEKEFDLPVVDLSADSQANREVEIECHLDLEARRPFNLAEDIMLRACLLKLSQTEHILILSVHHIASDDWSMNLLNVELAALYQDFCENRSASLPELTFQYGDFARAQRERFQGDLAARQIQYWKKQLEGDLPVMELPIDRPRPTSQSFRGSLEYFKFPAEIMSSLKELSRREGVTVYAVTLAAFQILLQRYSRQDDILMGSPFATRSQTDSEKLIGYFINMLVLRSDLSGNPTFQDLLRQVNGTVHGALAHQDVPLEKLIEELKMPRQPGRNPLVEVVFQFIAEPVKLPAFDSVTFEPMHIQTRTSKFDLTFTLQESTDGLRGEVEYNTDLFDVSTIQRMLGHYQVLLEAIIARPSERIANLPLLTSREEQQLVSEWNNTGVAHDGTLIHKGIEDQAARHPNQIAVACGDSSLTYAQLNEGANRLARHLQKNGVEPETPVCLCLERSTKMMLAILAVLKAGGAYVPLDPGYPNERLALMLEETTSPLLITREDFRGKTPSHVGKTICIDSDWPTIEQESSGNVVSSVEGRNLAYIIFTSGSTGRPKGVLVTHDNLVHSTMARFIFYREPVENFLLMSSFSFDSSVAGIFWTLASGGTLTIPQEDLHNDPAELIRLIEQTGVSHFLCLPSFYQLILESASARQLASLKVVIVAGEPCSSDLVKKHNDTFGFFEQEMLQRKDGELADASSVPVPLFNEYGPTEASVWSTAEPCRPVENARVPIGKPIPNAQIYLLDAQRKPVPIGVAGELFVGGAGVVRGYLNDATLTARRFIPDPFSGKQGARLYKTGDLASFRPDGRIDFHGRIDHQVKIRGYRIELGEIEIQLKQCDGVRNAIVIVQENKLAEKFLVAYLAADTGVAPTPTQLRDHLKMKLPDYMVPAAFVQVEALHLMPNGKLERKNLPAPEIAPKTTRFVAPQTLVEQQLAQIWSEVLGVERVGLHDNFFELGGHSLLAARAVSRFRAVSQKSLELRDFFQSPTVAELSAILEKGGRRKTGAAPELVAIRRRGASVVIPKTSARLS